MIERLQQWVKNSATFKFFAILLITLLLLIPGSEVESLIRERQLMQDSVVNEISDKWGNRQTLGGPFLTVPYRTLENVGLANEKRVEKILYVLPNELNISGEVISSIRKRSIYKAILYQAELNISGTFDLAELNKLPIDSSDINWEQARWSLAITDPRGISDVSALDWGKTSLELEPGLPKGIASDNGLQCAVTIDNTGKIIPFSANLKCRGSSSLLLTPVGKITSVTLRSDWPDPSFTGAFLPEQHDISAQGFDANWKVLNLNRSFNQLWVDEYYNLDNWSFGFDLIENVDTYQKTNRAAKYAFLIIVITFTFFFFFEILRKLHIHPIQYIIVGFAILVFYILLLAFSEQMAFGLAFLLSATGTIGIVTYYFYHISKSSRVAILFASLFTFLYVFIYVILNAEAYSLLIGSIGLFILIATIIHFTRNVDWYNSGSDTTLPNGANTFPEKN